MKINKQELQTALTIVKPGLANKEIIEQTTSFAFIGGRVVTYNDEISISHPVKGLQLEGAIRAEELYKLLTKVKKDEIEMEVTGSELILTSGRTKAGFTLQQTVTLPLEDLSGKKMWTALPENFIKQLDRCVDSCGKDMSRPVLTAVAIRSDSIVGSDGYRLIKATIDTGIEDELLIPATSAKEVISVKVTHISISNEWVHFKNDQDTIISCRTFEDKYPNFDKILQVEGIEITFPKTIQAILDRAAVMAKKDSILDDAVVITIGDNRIKIRKESDLSWFEEEANIRYAEDPIEFSITPYLFAEVLNESVPCAVGQDRIKFTGDDWVYVAMLRAQ